MRAAARTGKKLVRAVAERVAGSLEARYFVVRSDGRRLADRSIWSIAPILKRIARWIGLPERFVDRVSGHSTRVGATQDLAALVIDLAAITQAGGWKSTRMPLQPAGRSPDALGTGHANIVEFVRANARHTTFKG